MEIKSIQAKGIAFIQKNKYVVLIIILGLVFMLMPSKKNTETETHIENITVQESIATIEERLSEILRQIDGAGKVEVMLTIAKGEETVYQTDNETTTNVDAAKFSTNTVIITDTSKNQSGLIRQTISPTYMGAIIVCQGADDPNIRLAITEAVGKITGLKSNHISILKMR